MRKEGWATPCPPTLMETANHSLEMEKHQIAIPSSSERDKGTFPKDTPHSESPACKGETIADQPPVMSLSPERERH